MTHCKPITTWLAEWVPTAASVRRKLTEGTVPTPWPELLWRYIYTPEEEGGRRREGRGPTESVSPIYHWLHGVMHSTTISMAWYHALNIYLFVLVSCIQKLSLCFDVMHFTTISMFWYQVLYYYLYVLVSCTLWLPLCFGIIYSITISMYWLHALYDYLHALYRTLYDNLYVFIMHSMTISMPCIMHSMTIIKPWHHAFYDYIYAFSLSVR
jgi:hypothetical protein